MTRKIAPPSRRLAKATTALVELAPANAKQTRSKRARPGKPVAHAESFPIVGVGVSAGGSEAFSALLKHLPCDSGMAFVLIQDVDPKHPSNRLELLAQATKMAVVEVDANTLVEPNHVYTNAAGVSLSMSGSRLRAEPYHVGRNLPIDPFFFSSAQEKALPYWGTDNSVQGALLLRLDVDAVKNARNYAEAIIETVRQPLLVLTKELKIRSANQGFYSTFKMSKEQTEDCSVYDLGNGQWEIPKLRELFQEILLSHGSFRDFEVDQSFIGIGHKTMLLSARELTQLPPKTDILLAIEDITSSRSSDDQIRRTNEDLKHFAYAASHDLQEPLRMVMTSTQLLSRDYQGKLDSNADQFIHFAVEGAQRMDSLLKGMREYWQVSERGEENCTAVDCNEILERALLNLQQTITTSGAVVTNDPLPTVWAERVMLVELFQNLIGNAVKFRGKKPPKIHISAEKRQGNWIFSVQDNGIGIDPNNLKKVFDMFKRLNGARYLGAGIGLAICRKVVERLGGEIWAESDQERGSKFMFTVPFEK
jgi:signal transduction histidine kinase